MGVKTKAGRKYPLPGSSPEIAALSKLPENLARRCFPMEEY